MTENFSHRQTLFFELDRNSRHQQTLTWQPSRGGLVVERWSDNRLDSATVGSNLRLGMIRSPSPGLQARIGWDTCPASLLYKKKTSGMDIRRTPDLKLKFVSFNRFVGFNFGLIQLLRFVVVMVQSNSFGHLDSVKWITRIICLTIVLLQKLDDIIFDGKLTIY